MKKIILLSILVFSFHLVFSTVVDSLLIIQNKKTLKQKQLANYTLVVVKTKDQKKFKGELKIVSDTTIQVDTQLINLNQIDKIYKVDKRLKILGIVFTVMGIVSGIAGYFIAYYVFNSMMIGQSGVAALVIAVFAAIIGILIFIGFALLGLIFIISGITALLIGKKFSSKKYEFFIK